MNDQIKRLSKQMWLAGEERELWRHVYVAAFEYLLDELQATARPELSAADVAAGIAADAAVVRYQRAFGGVEASQSVQVGGNDEQH